MGCADPAKKMDVKCKISQKVSDASLDTILILMRIVLVVCFGPSEARKLKE